MRVLVVNAGSSTLKLSLIGEDEEALHSVELAAPGAQPDPPELRRALDGPLGTAEAVGHRIVHGGERYVAATMIDARVRRELGELTALAPLHQPKSLAALDAVSQALPDLPAVACFDTAFHAGLPDAAATYALPREWRKRWALRRYGFHGLSHAWVARRVPQVLGVQEGQLRIVSCHLGAGASLCAISGGRSVDTTMGFTPLEGLVMATRSGSVDPGLLLWLVERQGVSPAEVADTLEHRSGLAGLAGTGDMREVLARAAADPHARLALQVYVHRLRAGIAAMASALGGVDVLAFTGGVGERAPAVRAAAADGLEFVGVGIDADRNQGAVPDAELTRAGSPVRTVVLRAREDLEIARQTRAALRS